MSPLHSMAAIRFRRTFVSVFLLSSILPLLILIFFFHEHVFPLMESQQVTLDGLRFKAVILWVVLLLIPILGFFLFSRWIKLLESLVKDVSEKTAKLLPEAKVAHHTNEMEALRMNFDGVYSELQEKMRLLNDYSRQLIDSNIMLVEQVITDELTSLYNRRHFDERLVEEGSRSQRHHSDLTLIMMDVDDFKKYNDTEGHPAGDELLRRMGLLIRGNIRRGDLAFRYGGDEFAVLLPQCSVHDGTQLAKKFIRALSIQQESSDPENNVKVSISCGVSGFTGDLAEFVRQADRCLYKAKSLGKARVVFAEVGNSRTGA